MINRKGSRAVLVTLVSLLVATFFMTMFGNMDLSKANRGNSSFISVSAAEIKVTTANLNLRSGPGTGYSIITVMPKGAEVTVTGYSGGWAKVNYGNYSGYASNTYLALKSSGTTYYTTANLNLRTGPGTGYTILAVMPKGSAVTVLSTSGGWSRVTYSGKTGYASASYLSTAPPSGSSIVVRYTTADLNLRTGPGTAYPIITTMPKGSSVEILDTSSAWPKIRYGSAVGYASPSYLSANPPSTTSGGYAVAISKGNEASSVKRIAITFDDFGSVANIHSILNTLDAYGAKSTFFPNGEWIANNPTIVKEIAARGHIIESHGYSHPDLTTLSEAEIRRQLRLDREIIRNTVGTTSYLLRPPYGAYNSTVRRIAGEEGYRYLVLWSIDTSDWATTRDGVTITPSYIVNITLQNASQNGIVLMHMHSSKTVEALPTLLQKLSELGYHFVTVNDMVN